MLHGQSFNPISGMENWHVISEGNFTFTGGSNTHIHGALAVGGNLVLSSNFSSPEINMDGVANYVFSGDGSAKTGLLVKGSVTWPASGGDVKVQQSGFAHIGSSSGSTSSNNGGSGFTQVLKSGNAYNSSPRIGIQVNQSTNVFQTVSFDFTTLFNTFRTRSTQMSSCSNNVILRNPDNSNSPYSTPYNFTSSTKVNITGLNTGTNVLNLTQASLNNISDWSFNGVVPSSTKPLVINVEVTSDFTWNNPQFSGISQTSAPYVIWNFYGSTTKTITMNQTRLFIGTIFSPNHNFVKSANNSTDIEGSVIGKTVSLNTGEIHIYNFNATITGCETLTCSASITGPSNVCSGDSSYYVASATGGTISSYLWSNGSTAGTIGVDPSSNTSYSVTVTLTNGCTSTASKSVTVSNPPTITQCEARVNSNWLVLNDCIVAVSTGTNLALSVNPGTYPSGYTQTWTGPNGFTATGNDAEISSSVTTSHEGNYTFTVSNGICEVTQNIYVSVNQNQDCSCLSGNLVVNGNFTSSFTGWSRSGNEDSGVTSCSDGINKAYVANSNGSEAVLSQTIAVSASTKYIFSFMAGTHSPSGTHRARVKFLKNGGNQTGSTQTFEVNRDVDAPASAWCLNLDSYGPYEFTSPSDAINILIEFVEVTANNGYIKVAKVDLKKCNGVPTVALIPTNPDCSGDKGSVSFTTSGGTGTKTVKLNGNTVTSPVNNLNPGTYTFVVTDASACSSTNEVTITAPPAISASNTKVDVNCNGATTGSVNLTVSGGTPGYTYLWSNGATTEDISGLGAGTFTVTVTDSKGCTKTSSAIITQAAALVASNTKVDVNCNGATTGSVNLTVSGGTPGYTYLWSNGAITEDISGLGAGTFTVTVTDSKGCTKTSSAIITQAAALVASNTKVDVNCNGATTGSVNLTVSGGTPGYSYLWSNGATTEDISGLGAGTFTVTVTDSKGCTKTSSAIITEPNKAYVGNFTWLDTNGDGIQNVGELGVGGIVVNLKVSGSTIATTNTLGNGYYQFEACPGTYTIEFGPLSNFVRSPNSGNISVDNNSDANVNTGLTSSFILTAGDSITYVDAGYFQTASLGDKVWLDTNANGIQDGPETTGVNGVTVKLYNDANADGTPDGASIAMTTTSGNGDYSFTGLVPGNYVVGFTTPNGYVASPQTNNVGDDPTDSDASTTTGYTGTINLVSGENDPTNDAGIYQLASLGDKVWLDTNANGIQDGLETTGVNGVTVKLYNDTNADGTPDGVSIAMTTTIGNGDYGFTGLVPGNYVVGFTTPNGYVASPQTNNVGDDPTDSDASTTTGYTGTINLVSGENDPTNDAGIYQLASLGDKVWLDTNANGIQDGLETTGVNGVTVKLYNDTNADGTPDGVSIAMTTTIGNGDYGFTGLVPGNYVVGFTTPNGYVASPQTNTVGDDSTDSDASTTTGYTGTINLVSGENDPTNDAGMYQLASLGDKVWLDTNANGIQDGTETTGVNGVTVKLYNDTNADGTPDGASIAMTTTSGNGDYGFTGLVPGNYVVGFTTPNGYVASPQTNNVGDDPTDSDASTTTGYTGTINLVSGENDPTNDAGIYQLASLGDKVWLDTNANGIQDGPETTGVNGVTVKLYNDANADGTPDGASIAMTTTSGNGDYSFTGLVPGNYVVGFTTPNGYVASPQTNTVGDDPTDSDASTTTGYTGTINLVSGENDPTNDAGMYQLASLGDRAWLDINANGIQDPSEITGVGGVSVKLYVDANADGTPDGASIAMTSTNGSGIYGFTGLTPGNYIVEFIKPLGYASSPQLNTVGDDPSDSDANTTTGRTGTINLVSGEYDPTNDVGYVKCPDTIKRSDNVCLNFTFNLGVLVPSEYVGGTWFDINGSPVPNPGAVNAGDFKYIKVIGNGCDYVILEKVILTIPDYTSNIVLAPNNIQGTKTVKAIVTISEINLVENCRQIIVRVPAFQDRYNFNWNSTFSGTVIPGISANNNDWEYLGVNSNFHIWRYIRNNGTFTAGSQSRFVFEGPYNPLGSDGFTSFNVAVNNGSGGEVNFANNAASQILTFRK